MAFWLSTIFCALHRNASIDAKIQVRAWVRLSSQKDQHSLVSTAWERLFRR